MHVNQGAAAWVAAPHPRFLTSASPQAATETAVPTLTSRSSASATNPSMAAFSSGAIVKDSGPQEPNTPETIPDEVAGWLLEQTRQARVKEAEAAQQERLDRDQIQALAARDREVRAHEQAHVAVGGRYAGAPKYQFERGPDGVQYAVGGEVPISTGKEATPQETLLKAQIVRRAALAPAEPSAQDYKVAAQATRLEAQARQELAELQAQERMQLMEATNDQEEGMTSEDSAVPASPLEASDSPNPLEPYIPAPLEKKGHIYRIATAFYSSGETLGNQIKGYV